MAELVNAPACSTDAGCMESRADYFILLLNLTLKLIADISFFLLDLTFKLSTVSINYAAYSVN